MSHVCDLRDSRKVIAWEGGSDERVTRSEIRSIG